MKNWISIGQFAKQVGISARALRLYEKRGLLKSVARGENGYRYYRDSQISQAQKIRELKTLGFTLTEIRELLEADVKVDAKTLAAALKRRLSLITREEKKLSDQKVQIQSILSSIEHANKAKALSEQERKYVMSLFETVRIVVTGVEDLEETARCIQDYLATAHRRVEIVQWDGSFEIKKTSSPTVVILHEKDLGGRAVSGLNPDVVVIRNVGGVSKGVVNQYLQFYANVGPHMATVFNADDRASIEIAKSPVVQKGKIYYFSKNSGLKDQIEAIGGTISDGEEITVYGFNRRKSADLNIKVEKIRPHREEIALIAALTAVMDIGMQPENIARTV